jgi:GT2 family glycosyltransferase
MTVAQRLMADDSTDGAIDCPFAKIDAAAAPSLPRVSVIIVNWNRFDDVLTNVRFLQKVDYRNVEIIVVDNGSTDGSAERLRHVIGVRVIELDSNAGPSVARNVGIQAATGKYVLFLDSDAFIARRGLRALVDRMEADATIGVAGCRIFNWHTRAIDQWVYAEPYRTHGDRSFDSYSFSAAGALVRADVLRAVGGFWERLFIYNEEVDLSIRVIRAGYRVVYEPAARVFHRPCADGRTTSDGYFRRQIRNWIWIFFRHYSGWRCWWKVTEYSALYVLKGLANRQLRACLAGILDGLRGRAIAAEFAEKLTAEQAHQIALLNRRWHLRLWNIAPGATPKRKRTRLAALPLSDQRQLAAADDLGEAIVVGG